tara:strand:- start:91608 stop:92096 length:489 start_codon:yes stop_codon:yes gene_type:complete
VDLLIAFVNLGIAFVQSQLAGIALGFIFALFADWWLHKIRIKDDARRLLMGLYSEVVEAGSNILAINGEWSRGADQQQHRDLQIRAENELAKLRSSCLLAQMRDKNDSRNTSREQLVNHSIRFATLIRNYQNPQINAVIGTQHTEALDGIKKSINDLSGSFK